MGETDERPVRWLPVAERDLDRQVVYIAERNPGAAERMARQIADVATRLRYFFERGRPGRVGGTRELVVTGTPFVVIYRVRRDEVVIVRLLHGAQRWPPSQ